MTTRYQQAICVVRLLCSQNGDSYKRWNCGQPARLSVKLAFRDPVWAAQDFTPAFCAQRCFVGRDDNEDQYLPRFWTRKRWPAPSRLEGCLGEQVASVQPESTLGICAQIEITATQSHVNGGNWVDVPKTVPGWVAACIYLLYCSGESFTETKLSQCL